MFETFCGYMSQNNFNIVVIIKNSLTKTNKYRILFYYYYY